ncbi:MBL fold metallo-hydrolase [Sphingomonas aliaeris]|uniref:MBL fold metallo-hydrolase n=1 Tax=Sphingomonas aliaeris TaxID=2759526 RepID=A0A974S483_9SPHN|nr:MBL fold metallo-hydrolase [Sphingomonas aliaeris]QQV77307.1 MBL fold metallo-hydrolase [Sphingomonas aliaeris]
MTKVILLDVGHGNCAIVRSGGATAVIDSPTGAMLLDTLRDLEVETVETAIISHADKDHIAGILSLLTSDNIRVERIYVNPDSQKNTRIWRDFRVAVAVAEQKGSCKVVTGLSTTIPGTIEVGAARIAVLCPSSALALTGVGGTTASGRKVDANTLSGVLRIDAEEGAGSILMAADMDETGLAEAIDAETNLEADVLVFPHHGGLPGTSDAQAFTTRLLTAVRPDTVVFSNGRGRHDNPRLGVVETVRHQGCAIACTQLSERCHSQPVDAQDFLEPLRASGRTKGFSCAGSMTLELQPKGQRTPEHSARHRSFISEHVATPMCRHRSAGDETDSHLGLPR